MDLVTLKKKPLDSCSDVDCFDGLRMNKTFAVSACVTVWLTVISGSLKWGRVGTDFTASGKPSQCVCVYSIYGSCAEARGQTALQCVICPKRLRAHIFVLAVTTKRMSSLPGETLKFREAPFRSCFVAPFFLIYSNKGKKPVQECKQQRSHIPFFFCMKAILLARFCDDNISKNPSQSSLRPDELPSCARPHIF